ncbi:response regulator [Marinobacter halodurans]|uniref:Response regulator n=1 Tax=Marinobacter halodurans TaxID=2528979 RepID=A0ABY1ZLR9_9GAMM|nr:response regulator [Marinobacter halodurans]TBW55473.1 response regulator [Marinobacter halodurans]
MTDLRRVLCVDDEPDIRAVAELALGAVGGFEVTVCASGEDALAVAPDKAPQLILLDVLMPGMDGPETLSSLRRIPSLAAVPVVFMTARAEPSEMEAHRALGAVATIAKPFDPMTLAETVRSIWRDGSAGAP